MDVELSIVMPVFNERATILEILRRVAEVPLAKQIIVVDDASTDGTRELLRERQRDAGFELLLQPWNRRKGGCVKLGLTRARGRFAVIQDADLEYDPQDLVRLVERARAGDAIAVFGSRHLGARDRGRPIPRTITRVGGDLVNEAFNRLHGARMTDVGSCYKLARTETLAALDLRREGFDLDYEIASKLFLTGRRAGLPIVELPIHYEPRTKAEGKKIGWLDGLSAAKTIWELRRWAGSSARELDEHP